jgi:pyruvate-formate lyase-activating enzyme
MKSTRKMQLASADKAKPLQEWSNQKRWNPFNSNKLLAHVDRWKHIKRGRPIPPPILVTVDPTNKCNFGCVWCNAAYIRRERNNSLSERALMTIADFLPRWGEGNGMYEPGVKAICVAGGGEPFLNAATAPFIDRVIDNGLEVGVVTNGSIMEHYVDTLSRCTWVGVSVDAGTSKTFDKLKNMPPKQDTFKKVLRNIATVADYARRHKNKLGWAHPAYGVSYKYLLYKENIGEIYEATRLAKEIGCKNIHFRPAGTPWDQIAAGNEITFTQEEIGLFQEQIAKAMELDGPSFGVFGITHKFNDQFARSNEFNACYAIFMTAVFMPPKNTGKRVDTFVMGLCCDRRGDSRLELLTDEDDVQLIGRAWGGKRHWEIHDAIDICMDCPRCTYQPHNQIYEQVILNDSMTYKFI